ncbi:hydroxyacid dehydrogenase [Ramlibacter sp. WS9]|uniref:hydroxyacid dehydrogenase n=1 Tax=Ramlibacter sp. WS9 TaxID=1882741 RepID=UPI001E5CBA7A|nr:hydroxyacid dehydrogenase [Ramlibacter sp. WS9]
MKEKAFVLATDPFDDTALPELAGTQLHILPDLRSETYRPLMRRAHVFVVRSGAPVPRDILDDSPNLLGLVRHGVGLDVVPMDAAKRLAVPVANTPGSNAQSVAEYGMMVMGMLSRRLHIADATLRQHGWNTAKARVGRAHDLSGKSVGIVGLGEVGSRLARICHMGFGMQVLGHQRRPNALAEFVRPVTLEEIFERSDFVVLACPLTPETRRMVSQPRLRAMKPSAFLVNLARGELIDTDALLAALDSGGIAGAALDVFDQEPLPPQHPFFASERLILTPHLAARTCESDMRTSAVAARQVMQLLRGEAPQFLVNPSAWAASASRRVAILERLAGS